jgi:hypothetical protein
MAVTYTWFFNPLDVKLSEDGLTNVVYNVNWRLIGTDGTYLANVYGSVGVPAPSPAAFTPYDQLTESMVQGWVVDALGTEQVTAYEQGIAAQIALQQNPVDASLSPPWSN